jgi:hypothetical protein
VADGNEVTPQPSWSPCDDQPFRHTGPVSAARVHRIHTVVRSALGEAVMWGWIRCNPAEHAEPGEILEKEVEPPADVDVVQLLAAPNKSTPASPCSSSCLTVPRITPPGGQDVRPRTP